MSNTVSESMRQAVAARANFCCEYCKTQESDSFFSFQIDHIISRRHGGSSDFMNLAWSCYPCNHWKAADIGTILLPREVFTRLFNPRKDVWSEHFEIEAGKFYAKTDIGEATIKLLNLNDLDRIIERQQVLN